MGRIYANTIKRGMAALAHCHSAEDWNGQKKDDTGSDVSSTNRGKSLASRDRAVSLMQFLANGDLIDLDSPLEGNLLSGQRRLKGERGGGQYEALIKREIIHLEES